MCLRSVIRLICWGFKAPSSGRERADAARRKQMSEAGAPRRRLWLAGLFAASGLVPLTGLGATPPSTFLLPYSLFVLACLLPIRPGRSPLLFVLAFLATGALVELAAWAGHWAACSPEPVLFHPQLGADLLIAAGFYAGGGLAWAWLFGRYGFSLTEAVMIHGAMGVFVENRGAAFLAGLATLPAGALLWLFVFATYAAMVGLPRRLFAPPRGTPPRRGWHYPMALAAVFAATLAGTYGFGLLYLAAGGLPAPRPICAAPFW